ncbi:MAG: glycosyltransferase family 2 protein [Pseudomonadota bacterium]|mgnify:CR=1 FL=1|nr:glycosyltransferase family 2 protein [Pseudomonadota bacterium]
MSAPPSRPDIIVPIYNAAALLEDALSALLRTLDPNDRVLLIDDASTEPRIATLIDDFQRSATFSVLSQRNDVNLGFVRTVNRGMALSSGDVVLLNSDTVVTTGWLDRMLGAAASDARIATVTPFSNNAEICSFPEFCIPNAAPVNAELLARSFSTGAACYPDLPTAVGFCMYIRRRALNELGDFDAATFGRGYGEENDFCCRAAAHGWRNVLCDTAFVVHRGGASFALTGERPGGDALVRLNARYPRYNAQVAEFIRADPLAPIRAAALARLATI